MPRRVTPTVAECGQDYLRCQALNMAASTLANHKSLVTSFARFVGPERQIGSLAVRDVEDYFLEHVGPRNASSASYNKVRNNLRQFLLYCGQHGWVRQDLMGTIRNRPQQARRKRLRLKGPDLLRLLATTSDPRDRAMLATAMNTAMRASELVGLRVGDVDLAAFELSVYVQKTREHDVFPMSGDLEHELRRWMTTYAHDLHTQGVTLEKDMRLFPARAYQRYERRDDGMVRVDGPWQPHKPVFRPSAVVHRALARAGFDERDFEGFHTIRRAVGQIVFDEANKAGRDAALREVATVLHHKRMTTTEAYLDLQVDREARDRRFKGKPFLNALFASDNVVPLRPSAEQA